MKGKGGAFNIWCMVLAMSSLIVAASGKATAATIDFESVPLGTSYGSADGQSVGDIVLEQDGIRMSVELFEITPQSSFFNQATVGGRQIDVFPTTPLELNNISTKFDFSNIGRSGGNTPTLVTIDFHDLGVTGVNNFAVNVGEVDAGPLHIITSLADLPESIAPGVIALIDDRGFGEPSTITLLGPIRNFLIGGQELSIDTIVAIPEPATLALLGFGAVALLRRRRNQRTDSTSGL